MQDDLADATRWAIAQGHADPARICIAGASYSGYATLMGLARHPELFKCGVNRMDVTDSELMFSTAGSGFNEETKRYGLARLVGDPLADAQALKAASPLHNAALIKQPLIMAYGAWDTRVPLVHGERLRDALKPHNEQVEWVGLRQGRPRPDPTRNMHRFLGSRRTLFATPHRACQAVMRQASAA